MSGLRFECTKCGRCCTNHGEYVHVYLSSREVGLLARHLEVGVEEFERRYTFIDEDGWTQLKIDGGRCVFLNDDNTCGVHLARPTQCRTFPFWHDFVAAGEWTDEVREMCEGIGRGRLYPRDEAERLMVAMEESDAED